MRRLVVYLAASFAASGVYSEPLFPEISPPASQVDVVDLVSAPLDTLLSVTTLQGAVNGGRKASLYLRTRPSDDVWLRYLEDRRHIRGHAALSVESCFAKYAACYGKVLVYDPAVPATMNVATMMASLEPAVVVAPADVARFAQGKPIDDLRGRWTSNVAAYRWAFENLWPRMSHRVLASYHPTATHHFLRDYLVRAQVFTFWVSGSQPDEAESALLREILAQAPVNVPVIGWWSAGDDPGITEYGGVGLAGEYGKLTVACDWAPNLSLLSGVPAKAERAIARYRRRERKRPRVELQPDKVYIAYDVVESGDSPGYMQDIEPGVWDDPKRGQLPINWSVGAPVLDLLPPVAEYFFEKATPADHLYLAISGAAYTHPFRAFMTRTPDPNAGWQDYIRLTQQALRRMDSPELGLYTDAWRVYDRASADPTVLRFVHGLPGLSMLVMGMGRDEGIAAANSVYPSGPVIVSHVLTRWPVDFSQRTREQNVAWLVEDIRSQTPTERPAFVQAMALSWAFRPSDIAEVHRLLGEEYEAVTLPEFDRVYRLCSSRSPRMSGAE